MEWCREAHRRSRCCEETVGNVSVEKVREEGTQPLPREFRVIGWLGVGVINDPSSSVGRGLLGIKEGNE